MKLRFSDKMPTVNLQCPGLKKNHRSIILLGEQCNNSFRGVWKVNLTCIMCLALHLTQQLIWIHRRPAQIQGSGGWDKPSGANGPKRRHSVWAWRPSSFVVGSTIPSFDLYQLGTVSLILWLGATISQLGTDHPLPVCEGVPPLSQQYIIY